MSANACLELTYQGQSSRFSKSEVDRERLYGSRKVVAVDADGRECVTALLTRDGHVLPAGCTAELYLDESGDVVARSELVAVDERGEPLRALEPTTGAQKLECPVPAQELLEYVAVRVHALHAVTLAPGLAEALKAGAVFRVQYRPRRTVVETSAFLLGSDSGVFLVQAEPCGFGFVGLEQPALPEDGTDKEDVDAFVFPEDFGGSRDAA